ncbi:hypothetical protein LEP1GSC202_1765 [Leptospira yanagawae serovar Saopaulo str. Sao Paulo = ATCC 700523]|uniref:Rod shape-determining protein MreD n=1 Tax=Leptospira yanagawae serovar Saopaulo str. Sao Paulo = ATCC 700523 TaxID=1249483 RepID=A0A5E8HE33_9LEPT|nr:DUF6580 family putative transport protein [Leptospira yanagawae]EOQ89063.1 hypothetical protein LEP1GSC202_1765 [Leptospira yanagawae serovar Saopaulo str. Sao Paulo = ATCC 700523]
MFQSRVSVAILMVIATVLSRILPHPPNFTPVLAVSLFSGAYLADRRIALVVPILAMFVSDLYLGLHDLMPVVYGFMVLSVLFGKQIGTSMAKSFGYTVVGSVLFFVVTNLAVWFTSGMYSLDVAGLSQCFVLALPFFQNSILGDLVYSGILFGAMAFLNRTVFQTAKQTV